MQGPSREGRRSTTRFALWLTLAHVVAATLIVLVLTQFAPFMVGVVPLRWLLGVLVAAGVVGIVVDLRAVRARWLSIGLGRQTPKSLQFLGEHAWITPLVWGFDTGLIWTTYRVSFCSWLLLLMAVTGFAGPGAGAAYGMVFSIGLLAEMLLDRPVLPRWLPSSAIPAQLLGVGSMAVLVVVATMAFVGYA